MATQVLVVENDDRVRHYLANQLESLVFTEIYAISGAKTVSLLAKHSEIDSLFIDIMMPGGKKWTRARGSGESAAARIARFIYLPDIEERR